MHYIEGTIDSIAIERGFSFSLMPSSTYLIPIESEKMALFVEEKKKPCNAKLLSCEKNDKGHEIVRFIVDANASVDISAGFLLEAKNNRNNVRAKVESVGKLKQSPFPLKSISIL